MYTHRRWNLNPRKEGDEEFNSGHQYTWFPFYEDTSDPNTLQWWLIYYK